MMLIHGAQIAVKGKKCGRLAAWCELAAFFPFGYICCQTVCVRR